MIKKKSFWGFMVTCCLIVSSLFVFTACGDKDDNKDVLKVVTESGQTTTYETLSKEIIEGVEAGSTITLLKDYTYTGKEYFSLKKSITIDFGGHTLSTTQSAGFDLNEQLKNETAEEVAENEVSVVLKNGTLDAYKWGFWVENGAKLTIESNFTILANRAEATTNAGIVVVGTGSTLHLYGTVKVKGDTNAVSGNGSTGNGGVVMNIYDGAVIECLEGNGVYMPHTNTLNIGSATITGKTAVFLRSGITTINGATLKAIGEKVDYVYESGKQNSTGDAIVIDSVGYPGGAPTLNLRATTITSDHGSEIAVYEVDGHKATINNSTSYDVVTKEITTNK